MKRNSGYLVETKDGKKGRTYHIKGLINGKVPVYLATKLKTYEEHPGIEFAIAFSDTAILCDPKTLKQYGFID